MWTLKHLNSRIWNFHSEKSRFLKIVLSSIVILSISFLMYNGTGNKKKISNFLHWSKWVKVKWNAVITYTIGFKYNGPEKNRYNRGLLYTMLSLWQGGAKWLILLIKKMTQSGKGIKNRRFWDNKLVYGQPLAKRKCIQIDYQ